MIVEQFKRGIVDAILSIRILDEGIDIPNCKTAYILASQRSERQGIQRRGRILRKCEGKNSADLYDFIVVGPVSNERILSDLYTKEIKRAKMFAQDALNQEECFASIAQFK
jgi:superfamily II DNA or RNA helicase